MLTLIDLSNNNHDPILFATIRQHGVYGVWHKVTEGENYSDPYWANRSTAARNAGLRVGGYHFARPSRGTADLQAARFCSLLGRIQRRDLRPVLDLETTGGLPPDALWLWGHRFCRRVYELKGVHCLVYSGPSFIRAQRWAKSFGQYQWLAEYGPNDGHDHGATVVPPWKVLAAHQYTSVGKCPGVPGDVDLSHAPNRRNILAHQLLGLV